MTSLHEPQQHNTTRVMRWLFIISVGILPLIMGVGLLRIFMGANLSDIAPIWSDEIYYWHQIATFREANFNGGYYTVNENPAAAHFSHYYAWGAAVPAFYGILAHGVGWSFHAIPLLNLTVLSAALFAFLCIIHANRQQILYAAAVILTFVPFLLFSASSMLEVQQQGIAVGLAALFYYFLRHAPERNIPYWQWGIMIVLLVLATFLRSTWAFLFTPLCVLALPKYSTRNMTFAVVFGMSLFVIFAGLTQWMAAPYTNFVRLWVATLHEAPEDALPFFFNHFVENVRLIGAGSLLEVVARLQMLGLLAIVMGMLVQYYRQNRIFHGRFSGEMGLHLYNLGTIFLFNLLLYDMFDWRDYRVMTPHLLLSLMLLVAYQRFRVVILMIVVMCVCLFSLPELYRSHDWYGNHANPERIAAIHDWTTRFAPLIHYQADAESAWCNTLLHTSTYLFSETEILLAVPPGIGLSVILNEETLKFPLKSRYLLLDEPFYARYAEQLSVQLLVPVSGGLLAVNTDAACDA